MITTKAPDAITIKDWFVIRIYTDSLGKHRIRNPSGFKTLYCNEKDIWSCRERMMGYINSHLSDFVQSRDERILTHISKGYFGKLYSSPIRKDGMWVIDTDPYVPDTYPGKYRKVPKRPKNM